MYIQLLNARVSDDSEGREGRGGAGGAGGAKRRGVPLERGAVALASASDCRARWNTRNMYEYCDNWPPLRRSLEMYP